MYSSNRISSGARYHLVTTWRVSCLRNGLGRPGELSFIFDASSSLSNHYLELVIELTVSSLKSLAYFTLASDISETSALMYSYSFSFLLTKNVQSFNCECWNQNFSEIRSLPIITPLIYDNIIIFMHYVGLKKYIRKTWLV